MMHGEMDDGEVGDNGCEGGTCRKREMGSKK